MLKPCAYMGCTQERVALNHPYCLEHRRQVARESAKRRYHAKKKQLVETLKAHQVKVTDPIGDQVANAYAITSHDQREAVAQNFHNGNQKLYETYAGLLQISPTALLLAALLESGSEIVCHTTGRPRYKSYTRLAYLLNKNILQRPGKTCEEVAESGVQTANNLLGESRFGCV